MHRPYRRSDPFRPTSVRVFRSAGGDSPGAPIAKRFALVDTAVPCEGHAGVLAVPIPGQYSWPEQTATDTHISRECEERDKKQ